MYGVLLTGGLASRLGPITKVTNKHLLPVYDKPMVFYGIETLRDLGCDKIIIVLGGNSVGDIVNLVRDGSQFGVEVTYKFQHEPKGISDAILLASRQIPFDEYGPSLFITLLGDNIFGNIESLKISITDWIKSYETYPEPPSFDYAIFTYPSDHPHDYGQPILVDNKVKKFVEKDSSVNHNLIVTGLYGLNNYIEFEIDRQKPSNRGELEITDTLTTHLPKVRAYKYNGFWSDCGTPEGLVDANNYMKEKSNVKSS